MQSIGECDAQGRFCWDWHMQQAGAPIPGLRPSTAFRLLLDCTAHGAKPPPQKKTPHFLPLFLMPCDPVLSGPLPQALAAISLRAFSSADVPGQPIESSSVARRGAVRYLRASSRGRPCRRRGPCLPSWAASRAWPCRLSRGVSKGGGGGGGLLLVRRRGRACLPSQLLPPMVSVDARSGAAGTRRCHAANPLPSLLRRGFSLRWGGAPR